MPDTVLVIRNIAVTESGKVLFSRRSPSIGRRQAISRKYIKKRILASAKGNRTRKKKNNVSLESGIPLDKVARDRNFKM